MDIIVKDDFFKLPYDCELWEKRRVFADHIRSHPYNPQEQREKVLDEMLAALQNEGMAAWDERGYIRFIQSFRQGGE